MANFLNEIIESTIQPVKTNVLWIKNGVPYYYNKRWKPLLGGASGGTVDSPITFGEGEYSAILNYSNNNALGSRSIALGYNTTSYNNYEASFGKYNKSVKSEDLTKATLFSVGNGNATFPKNALEIKWDGSVYISGIDKSVQDYLGSIKTYDSEINDILKSLEELSDRITITDSKLETKFEEFEKGINGELEEYYSKLTQTAKEIRAEVGSITTELDGRITENTALISITAKEIRSEVSEITTDLDGRIETNKSSISQTAEEIRAEVSRVQTDLSGRIDTANSTISQTADAIRLEVEAVEGELNGKIERNTSLINQTAESIGLEVTNLSDHLNDVNSELAGLIAENKAAIEINANEIKNKVSSDTFNAFSGEVQNQFTEVSTTIEGVRTSVQNLDGKLTEVNATVNGITTRLGTAEADIESLKKQSDGSIDTHFGTEAPTLNNEPAVNWVTDDLKNEHTGDIYYNNNTGEAYRFSYNPETNEYFWVELTDSALTDALDKISKLESAVDGKVTIFYTTPTNYKYGDMWFVHEDNASFKKGTLVSATNLDKGTIRATLVLADWKEEIEYVNFDELTEELTSLNDYIDNAFKDGVLSEAEIKHIQELKKNFQLSYKEINDLNSFLIITAFATEENKTALSNAKKALDTAFNELIDAIDNLNTELDDEGNNPSLALYNKKYQAYLKALDDYTEIAVLIQSEAEQELLKPSDYIKQISSDGYLTSIEKKQLIAVWKQIAEEFTANRGIAFNYKILKKEGNNYIDRTDIYAVDTGYHTIYNNYKNSYEAIASIFTDEADPFGFKDLQNTTILSETTIESLASIEQLFDTYYANLALFSEMISKISNDITDAHQKVIDVTNALIDQLDPREAITQIGTGVVLSSVLGVKDIDGNLEAVLNGSDSIEEAQSTKHGNHGKIVFAGGINGSSKWDDATTIIYEDGHVVINSGEISDFVSIGNATFKNVVEAVTQFDVISSPHVNPDTGEIEYIPLFQVNRNDAGEIIYVSSVYDFVGNREISALGFNSGGGGSGGGIISTVYNSNKFGTITDNSNTATFNAYAIDSLYKRIVSLENKEVDLTGYATEAWVAGQGFITSAALSPYMKTADANDTFATKTALNNLSGSHDSLATRVSTAEGNISANATAITNLGKRVTANEGNIAEILKWFAVDSDGNLYTTYNFYSTKEISANGLSIGSGGSGGGLISQVYGTTAFGTIASESNSATFNAYAIDSLYKRIVSLEGKATAVSFVPAMTSGKQIGTLSIDGVSTVLYGVDAYSKADADGRYLKLTGGEINGYLSVSHAMQSIALGVNSKSTDYVAIRFTGANGNSAYLVYSGTGDTWEVTNVNWNRTSALLHANNYGDYAISKAGGTITKRNDGTGLAIVTPDTSWAGIRFKPNTATVGATLSYNGTDWRVTDDGWNQAFSLLHSGNFSQYALPLSGGTISNGNFNPLTIKGNSTYSGIGFVIGTNSAGYLVYEGGANWSVTSENWAAGYKLIHSGNIGSQSVDKATRLHTGGGSTDLNELLFSDYSLRYYSALSSETPNIPDKTGWQNALLALPLHGNGVTAQFYFTANTSQQLYYRSTQVNAWKTIAFTDSNVASATKLATARTIWGQSFDGTGNVTGALKTPSGYNAVTILDSYLVLGQGMAENSLPTYLDGYNVYMRYGKSSTIGFTLNSSGNVGIGTTTDTSGNKLQVNGTILSTPARESAYSSVLRGYQSGIVAGDRLSLVIGKESASKNAAYFGFTYDGSGSSKNFASIGFHSVDNILCVAATSYVGIGTTSPKHKLHVYGNIAADATDATNSAVYASNSNGTVALLAATNRGVYDANADRWIICSNGTNTWLPAGNVGIGASANEHHKLYVHGSIYADGNIALSSRLLAKSGVFCSYESTCGAYMEAGADGTYAGIYTCNNGAWQSSNIYLHNNGNVTINKHLNVNSSTNLKSTLSVTGAATMSSTLSVAGNINISTIGSAANNNAGYMQGGTTLMRYNGAEFGNLILSGSGGAMYFRPNGTTNTQGEMNLDGNGLLLVKTIDTAERIYTPYVFLGKNAEGIYLTYNSITWHNSSNNWASSLMGFTSTSIIAHQSITANSGVKVASGQALTFLDASGKEHKLTYDSTAGAFKFDGNILVLGDGQFNAIN